MPIVERLTLRPPAGAARPAPELVALAEERAAWKRCVRFLWCTFLILTGQLAFVTHEVAVRPWARKVSFLPYASPFTFPQHVFFRTLRSPPQFA